MTPFDTGDSAWLMMASAMVLLMAPGLAFFYGGMVKTSQVIAMLKMCFVCVVLVSIIWFAVGYTLAFGQDVGGLGLIGNLDHAFMSGVGLDSRTGDTPTVSFSVFHMSFAIVTVALISGSVAGRARMNGWIAFVCAWTLLVYVPMAHWVFSPGGWVFKQVGAVDFSGGTVVELSSGAAGLALALVAGRREDFERRPIRPHNLPLVVIGLSLLWFGWFGFNTGSSLGVPGAAAMGVFNTQIAAGAAMAGWAATSYWRTRQVGLLDMCMGAVTGMVAMTPLAGGVSPMWAAIIGFLAGLSCAFAISWKYRFGVDDTLDVVGIHGWGGLFGMVMVGLAATGAMTGKKGVFYGGGWDLLGKQLVAVLVLGLFSFAMTAVIGKVIDLTIGLRQPGNAGEEHEQVYQNDWDAQFKEIADALRGVGTDADTAPGTAAAGREEDASALLDQIRRVMAQESDQREQRRGLAD